MVKDGYAEISERDVGVMREELEEERRGMEKWAGGITQPKLHRVVRALELTSWVYNKRQGLLWWPDLRLFF